MRQIADLITCHLIFNEFFRMSRVVIKDIVVLLNYPKILLQTMW